MVSFQCGLRDGPSFLVFDADAHRFFFAPIAPEGGRQGGKPNDSFTAAYSGSSSFSTSADKSSTLKLGLSLAIFLIRACSSGSSHAAVVWLRITRHGLPLKHLKSKCCYTTKSPLRGLFV